VVDGLCLTLHITSNHLVIVNFLSVADIVNKLGGITVHLPHPVRDPMADLYLDESGVVHLDGTEALALVRSRNPQWLIGGAWTTVTDGSTQRTRWAGKVFESVLHSARLIGINPIKLQELAWAASGSLTTDGGTGLSSLWTLSRISGPVESLRSRVWPTLSLSSRTPLHSPCWLGTVTETSASPAENSQGVPSDGEPVSFVTCLRDGGHCDARPPLVEPPLSVSGS
jgi:hypothetical protein